MHYLRFTVPAFRMIVLLLAVSWMFSSSAESAQVTLAWDAPADSRVTGYKVYYGIEGTSYKAQAMETVMGRDNTSILLSNMQEGETYLFAVTSTDDYGNESDFSEEIDHTFPQGSVGDEDPIDDGKDADDPVSNLNPRQPELVAPDMNSPDPGDLITFATGSFSDPDGDDHRSTQWQISTDTTFDEGLVLDVVSEKHLTRLPVSRLLFLENEEYHWRVKHTDSKSGFAWSQTGTFSTGDGFNGEEDEWKPENSTDLDDDGESDQVQEDMRVVETEEFVQLGVKLDSNQGQINYLGLVDPKKMPEDGRPENMPFGLLNFRVETSQPGQEIEATVYLSEAAPEDAGWFKYDTVEGWQDYTENVTFSQDRKSIRIKLVDGGIGDADGLANGVIIDPSGLGTSTLSVGDEPVDDEGGSGSGGGGGGCFINSLF